MSDFSRYSNYKDNAGVSGVVFGAHSAVLEVEMNEMQEISKKMFRDFIKEVAGNGITDLGAITYANGALSIKAGCGLVVDGILVNCTGLTINATSGTVYLQVWEEQVTFSDTLNEEGNQQDSKTVANWAKDDRSDAETTRRLVTKYTLATSTNSSRHNLAIASISGGVMTKLVSEVNLSNLTARVHDIEGYIGITDTDVYGVEADWENNKFTRLAGSVGLKGGEDHDNIAPWNRRRCNIADDGTITAYYGDEGYTETGKLTQAIGDKMPGTRVQTMVEQNEFYYRMVPLKLEPIAGGIGFKVRKARYYISATPKAGFKIFPAFKRNGVIKHKIYDSAFKGSLYDNSGSVYVTDDSVAADFEADKLSSIANAKPASGVTNNLTRANSRKLAANNGTGWQQSDFLIDTMTAWLFLVEYATMDGQTVLGKGVCDITDDSSSNLSINTGGTSKLGNKSGMAEGDNGKVSVSYRGKEDPFGNIWSFSDGLNVEAKNKNVAYWADHGFKDDTADAPYQPCGFTLAMANGYISAFGWSEDCDFAFLPAETLGDSSKPVGDYTWVNPSYAGWLIARLGGDWGSGLSCGFCSWSLVYASSGRARSIGGRLVYIPDGEQVYAQAS